MAEDISNYGQEVFISVSVAPENTKSLYVIISQMIICGALRDLVAFVQFKKREKHPWRSVNFSKAAG